MDPTQMQDLLKAAGTNPGQLFFLLHGGAAQFDCWLSRTAGEKSPAAGAPPAALALAPPQFVALAQSPVEAVDFILDNLESAGVWHYEIRRAGRQYEVIDPVSGHVIEARLIAPGVRESLARKYEGPA